MSVPLGIATATEQAAAGLVLATALGNSLTCSIYTGLNNSSKDTAPAVTCIAEPGHEDFPFSGVYHVPLRIEVRDLAVNMTASNWGALATPIFAGFLNANLENNLATMSLNYFVYQASIIDEGYEFSGDVWSQYYTFDVVCATSANLVSGSFNPPMFLPPINTTSSGYYGNFWIDNNYLYLGIGPNQWRRIQIETWTPP